MTQHILAISNYLQSPIDAVLSFFKSYNSNRELRKRRNQTIKELSSLTDYELNDIGIARGDIRSVAEGHADMKKTETNSNLKGWV
jgi:uncharacterized protein YjiS (DUF1127 family)